MFGPAIRHGYTIRYATRPNMQDIFDTITIIGDAQGDVTIDDSQNQWQKQIDSLYIYNAAKTILKGSLKIKHERVHLGSISIIK